jgi:hypothetical protein
MIQLTQITENTNYRKRNHHFASLTQSPESVDLSKKDTNQGYDGKGLREIVRTVRISPSKTVLCKHASLNRYVVLLSLGI